MFNHSCHARLGAWSQPVAAALLAAALLAGCGGGGSDGGTTPAPAPPAASAPTITTQPASQTVVAGAAVTFGVAASGTAPISYQWKRDGNAIAGATAASYTLAVVQRSDTASQWTVAVSNSAGTVNSNAAVLTVGPGMVLVAGAPGGPGTALGIGGRLDHPTGLAIDAAGNLFVATPASIRRVAPNGNMTAIPYCCASPRGVAAGTDGSLYIAQGFGIIKILPSGVAYTFADVFMGADSVVVDAQGTAYVADALAGTISKIMSDGSVSTLAGMANVLLVTDGSGTAARFAAPRGIARDTGGNLYVADLNTIRKITPAGVVTTIAGVAGQPGTADGPAGVGRLGRPTSLAVDKAGNILIADSGNFTIRKLTPAGILTTITGVIGVGDDSGNTKVVDQLYIDQGLGFMAIDNADNLYFADTNNHVVRKMTPAGVITTAVGMREHAGNIDGAGNVARFDQSGTTSFNLEGGVYQSTSVSSDAAGNIYITANKTIRKVAPDGTTTTLALQADPAQTNTYYSPAAIGFDGSVYGYSFSLGTLFKTNASGVRTVLAGHPGEAVDGVGTAAAFSMPGRMTVDAAGNIYLLDRDYIELRRDGGFVAQPVYHLNGWESVRKITPAGVVTTIAGFTRTVGSGPGLKNLKDLVADQQGNVFVIANRLVIKIAPDGTRTPIVGTETINSVPGGIRGVDLVEPAALAIDKSGNLYVADNGTFQVYKIAAGGGVTTVAGRPNENGAVPGGSPTIGVVRGMTIDPKGTLYLVMENSLFKIEP